MKIKCQRNFICEQFPWSTYSCWHLLTKCCLSLDKNFFIILSWCSWNLNSLGKPGIKNPKIGKSGGRKREVIMNKQLFIYLINLLIYLFVCFCFFVCLSVCKTCLPSISPQGDAAHCSNLISNVKLKYTTLTGLLIYT